MSRSKRPERSQALGPFLNPKEQALPDSACVVYRVCNPVVGNDYPVTYGEVWNDLACEIVWPDPGDVNSVCSTEGGNVPLSDDGRSKSDVAYDNIALSIAAYESSSEVNAFSSKFDLSKGKGKGKEVITVLYVVLSIVFAWIESPKAF